MGSGGELENRFFSPYTPGYFFQNPSNFFRNFGIRWLSVRAVYSPNSLSLKQLGPNFNFGIGFVFDRARQRK
jgi:hypothetical protein